MSGEGTTAKRATGDTPFVPSRLPVVTRPRLADQAYAQLLHRIVTGEYREGAPLPSENELGTQLGISRPVVRAAIDRLRLHGLIESRRGSGTFVLPRRAEAMPPAVVAERQKRFLRNLEFRAAIEPEAAMLAARRRSPVQLAAIAAAVAHYERVAVVQGLIGEHLDFAFHLAVAEASHNGLFVEAIRTVAFDIDHGVNLLRYLARFEHLERSRSVLADHARILTAIDDENSSAARAAMRDHLDHARLRMLHRHPAVEAGGTVPPAPDPQP